jgi:hypothetical protein
MKNVWKKVFQLIMGATGISETLLGLSIIFFASQLQRYLATGILSEHLYLNLAFVVDMLKEY